MERAARNGIKQDAAPEEQRASDEENQLGARIRRLRMEQGMSLRGMARKSGVSVSFLSQVELGKASPSIATLIRMARSLDEHVTAFFEPRVASRLVRADERPKLAHPGRDWYEELLSPRDFRNLQLIMSKLAPGASSADEAFGYESAETSALVLSGKVEFTLDGETFALQTGDCLSFNSRQPHRVHNSGGRPATILWANSPPAY